MGLAMGGRFGLQVVRKGQTVATCYFHNGITTAGVNDLWDKYFRNGTPPSAWYIGLIDNTGFTAVDNADDTMGSHAGWSELTDYDEATRPAWGADAASGQTISNSTLVQLNMNAVGTIKGLFLTSDNTKSGTTGTLWCTGILSTTQAVQPADVVKLFYELLGQET